MRFIICRRACCHVRPAKQIISVLLTDDTVYFRTLVRKILSKHPEFKVVAEATTGEDAFELARTHLPHVCVMDIDMPGTGGIEATRRICLSLTGVKVLIFSSNTALTEIEKAAAAGARGFVSKARSSKLPAAINAILRGPTFCLEI